MHLYFQDIEDDLNRIVDFLEDDFNRIVDFKYIFGFLFKIL